jgi:hybrid cluster-associated redox disulfide protein
MKITLQDGIMETVQNYPATADVFRAFGMGCLGCAAARYETIEQGATAHGMDLDKLIKALNEAAV